jgi:hypothetical protein
LGTFCGLVGVRFCRTVARSQVRGNRGDQADAWLIAVRKFNASRLKCVLEQDKCGPPRSFCFALEEANSSYSDVRGVREALLSPVEQASCCPALGSCNHGPGRTKTDDSRQFDCFSIDSVLLI